MRVSTTLFGVCALISWPASAEGVSPQPASTGAGKPANLCRELVAFVQQPDPAVRSDVQPAQLSTAVQAPKQGSEEAKPSASAGAPQNTSGQSGQIPNAGPGAAGPQGTAQNTAPSGATANLAANAQTPPSAQGEPVPKAPPTAPSTPKPSPEAIQQVEKAASRNDLRGCRAVAQQMRRAGVAMPAPLLALSALNPRLLEAAPGP